MWSMNRPFLRNVRAPWAWNWHETDLGILRYYPPEDRQCGGIQYTWPYTGPYPYGPYTAHTAVYLGRWLRPLVWRGLKSASPAIGLSWLRRCQQMTCRTSSLAGWGMIGSYINHINHIITIKITIIINHQPVIPSDHSTIFFCRGELMTAKISNKIRLNMTQLFWEVYFITV
jgi:hypothetical protein